MPAALNLSNEVVKMRAEVKRVKVLIIRKLTRQIVALKKKKGSEANVERNQRRAARLLEEIHELKTLAPDSVTKAALLSDISFEKVCQKKESSLAERATARIATHPEFSKRIQSLKNAIEAFKAERISAKKKKKNSRDTEDQETESELDSDHEVGSEEEDDDKADDDSADGGSSPKIQSADEEQLKDPVTQNKDPVAAKEVSPETDSTPAEVVRMRKEVKKLRVLIIRTLAQQIAALKKAKSDDSELKGNTECVERLQKEVHVLRTLLPDHVTIRALEGDIDMEKVFQDSESSAVERATARIATHERFLKKLQAVRQAIEKEKVKKHEEETTDSSEMMKAGKGVDETEDEDKKEEAGDDSDDDDDDYNDDDDEKDVEEIKEEMQLNEKPPSFNIVPRSNVENPPENLRLSHSNPKSKCIEMEKAVSSPANPKSTSKPAVKVGPGQPAVEVGPSPPAVKAGPSQPAVKAGPSQPAIKAGQSQPAVKVGPSPPAVKAGPSQPAVKAGPSPPAVKAGPSPPAVKAGPSPPAVKVDQSRASKNKNAVPPPPPPMKPASESDTKKPETTNDPEESDLSDSEEEKEYFDDSTEERFRKQSSYSEQSDDDDDFFLGKVSKLKKKKSDTAPRPEKINHPGESREKNVKEAQEFKMRSVFCSALSKSSVSSQKDKHPGPKPLPFQNQRRNQKPPWVKNQGAGRERKPPGFKNQTPGSRGGGERKDKTTTPAFDRKNAPFHKAGKHSQQALHPSWEASRKRKEQQTQITAFQGKKIKFDDDDD